jgi:tryptophan synthase beta subunit
VPARLAAERDWTQNLDETYYLPDPSLAEDPHLLIARDLQGIVGHEARSQFFECEGRTPDAVVAWSGDGADAAGLFQAFADDRVVRTFGIDASVGAEAAPDAGRLLAATEGILPSFESSCALAFVAREGPRGAIGRSILIGLSGRADADGAAGDDLRARG